MTLPSERLKDWVILPSIVKLNENSEAPRMNPSDGKYSSQLELPDLKTRNWKSKLMESSYFCVIVVLSWFPLLMLAIATYVFEAGLCKTM